MNHKDSCHYSTRLITKLKTLDNKDVLDFPLIDKAICWAKKYHDGQYRKSGEPFYTHPLEVAYMISDYKLTTNVIVTSILHDIVEDTKATVEMLSDEFGSRISDMVDMLTRDRPDGTKLSVTDIINNAYAKNDTETLLIKIFDRLHNMRTLGAINPHKRKEIAIETMHNIVVITTLYHDLNLEKELNKEVFSILYDKDKATLIMNKKYNPLSVFDNYLPPLPNFQNNILHI